MALLAIAAAIALIAAAQSSGLPELPIVEPPQGGAILPAAVPPETAAEAPIVDTIDLEIERYRRLTVPVTIMGEGPFAFMIDTGAQATVLSRDLADRLQLFDRDTAILVGMASERQVEVAVVPEFALGNRVILIRNAPLVDGRNIGGADGILGVDSLQDRRVLLDFEHGVMSVTDAPDGTGGRLGYDIIVRARARLGQLIIHRAEIDGMAVDVIIDTGATGSIGNPALARRLERRRALDDAVMTDINGVQITGQTRVARRLQLGQAAVNNVPITFADSPTFVGLGLTERPALILGMSELRLFKRIAIDFRNQRVLFDMPDGVPVERALDFSNRGSRLE